MTIRRWVFFVLAACLMISPALACSTEQQPVSTRIPPASSTPQRFLEREVSTATLTSRPWTATPTLVPITPTATQAVSDQAVTDVQFALDVDQTGQLIFPAREFVTGVTRIYVRFAYQGLGDITEVKTIWYLNENPVSIGTLAWDGGAAGSYIIWVEDPDGMGRGQWRWELTADGALLGGGAFTIDGEPSYVNEAWGLSFDPPVTWKMESAEEDFVTFSSPDRKKALALRLAQGAADPSEASTADVAVFEADHPGAEVIATDEVTMSGESALLKQVRYTDEEGGERFLFVVSAVHAGSSYSLWVLGPADDVTMLKTLLFDALYSIRLSASE